jgi:hypothetical protein
VTGKERLRCIIRSRVGLAAVTAALCFAAAAPSAQAGPLLSAVGACGSPTLEQPFLRWLDPFSYTLVPGGSFESGSAAWTLSKAKVVSGNETFYVHAKRDSKSLSLPAGSSATSPAMCVDATYPTLRFFARSSKLALLSTLKVEVLYEDAAGRVLRAPIGVIPSGTSWKPTLPTLVVANLLSLLPNGKTAVAFRFTPVGTASWWIDDVYVDPRRR